jgi:hypothetical protein
MGILRKMTCVCVKSSEVMGNTSPIGSVSNRHRNPSLECVAGISLEAAFDASRGQSAVRLPDQPCGGSPHSKASALVTAGAAVGDENGLSHPVQQSMIRV